MIRYERKNTLQDMNFISHHMPLLIIFLEEHIVLYSLSELVCMCDYVEYARVRVCIYYSHGWHASNSLQTRRVANEFVECVDDVSKTWPSIAVFLPAVQHELVQSSGAIHWGRKSVVLFYSINHLHTYTY